MARKEKIVVDASVVTKWYSEEENTVEAAMYKERHVEGTVELVVPALLFYEVINALNYKPEFTEKDVSDSMAALIDLSLTVEMPTKSFLEKVAFLARKYGITAYDSTYVALAEELNAKMVTADKKLWKKVGGHPLVSLLAK